MCLPIEGPLKRLRSSLFAIALFAIACVLFFPGGNLISESQALGADDVGTTRLVPALSLETLFHPENRADYVEPLPDVKWLTDETGSSQLVLRREDDWKKVDLASGQLLDWNFDDELAQQIAGVAGVEGQIMRASVAGAIRSIRDVRQAFLVRSRDLLVHVRPGRNVPEGQSAQVGVAGANRRARVMTRDAKSWLDATLDPSGRLIAYTTGGDLYIVDVATGRSFRMTDDASPTILDGRLDWTYQEEIYGRGNYRGFRFSPQGNFLAMLRIDISAIEPYTLGDSQKQRGSGLVRRYSKAGDVIPHAELYVWDLRQINQGVWAPPRLLAKSTPANPQIITGMWWHPHRARFIYSISDRKQTWRE
ncbi:MAG: DPP IV N-terminal domain-containing protein, partial [Planctomycetota bacterium]